MALIYLVLGCEVDGSSVLGAYSNKDAAEKERERLERGTPTPDQWDAQYEWYLANEISDLWEKLSDEEYEQLHRSKWLEIKPDVILENG